MRARTKSYLSCLLCFLAGCMLISALSGCEPSGKKIAFFPYKSADTFISEMMDYMTAQVPEDVSYEVRDAGNSQSVQNQQIIEMIDDGYDLFVINVVDRLACSSIVEKCSKESLPVIFFNREPLKDALLGRNAYYVGTDAESQGEKQAEMVASLFTNNFRGTRFDKNNDDIVQLVILKGEQGHQDAEKRTNSCVARLKSLGLKTEVLAIEVADWNRKDGQDAMKRLYEDYGDEIELVFSNNDDMALGAIDYLLEAGVFSTSNRIDEQPFVIVGVDGTAVGLEAIERGLLYGTIKNDFKKQSDAIMILTDYILNDKSFNDFPYEFQEKQFIYINSIDDDIVTLNSLKQKAG